MSVANAPNGAHKDQVRARLLRDLNLPGNLAHLKANSSTVVRKNLPKIKQWARENGGDIWVLHHRLGVQPKAYRKDSGLEYKKADPRGLARALWAPPGEPEIVAEKLRKELKQNSVPKSPTKFFHSDEFKTWLIENNFHDLRDFTEFFGVALKVRNDGTRKQSALDLEKLVPEIWPAESLTELFAAIKKLTPQRPPNLQEYFVTSNKKLMTLLRKKGFKTIIDFFRYTGVVIKDRRVEDGVNKDPVINFQKLARKIWTRPNKSEIPGLIKSKVQAARPNDAHEFFRGESFQNWLATNGFSKLSEFSQHMGVPVTKVRYDGSPKLKINYAALVNKIWQKNSQEALIRSIKEDLNQDARPTKPKEFFKSKEFKTWLGENNFESLVSFGQFFGAKISSRTTRDSSRGKIRKKISRKVDYDDLARKIWSPPNLRQIRGAMVSLKISNKLKYLTSPYRFFNSPQFRTWLRDNNFRDLVHFCEKIQVPTLRTKVADRDTDKVSYDWQAMVEKLKLEQYFQPKF